MPNPLTDGSLVIPPNAVVTTLSDNAIGKSLGNTNVALVNAYRSKLFSKQLTYDMIKQGSLGNCWLIASLISICANQNGPALLRGVMKDNEDGTATVRVYDNNGTARYIKVDKSFSFKHSGQGGNIWVALVEKAMTALNQGVFNAQGATYARLQGGREEFAYKAVLNRGSTVHVITFDKLNPKMNRAHPSHFIDELFDVDTHWEFRAMDVDSKGYVMKSWKQVFGGNGQHFQQWLAWLKSNQNPSIKDRWTQLYTAKTAKYNEARGAFRQEDFEAFLLQHNAPQGPRAAAIAWVRNLRMFPGKRGTGLYTPEQMTVLTRIQGIGAKSNSYAAAKTRNTVGRNQQGGIGAGGEPFKAGLFGMHEYAVLETSTVLNLHYVKLVNPWQEKGRGYTQSQGNLKPQEIAAGVFNLELNDFVKRFSRVTVTV